MRRGAIVVLAVVVLVVAGCTGGMGPYRSINLGKDLDAATLARYQAETQQLPGGQHMGVLEHSNGWLLGLLAYWRQGTVRVMPGGDGKPVYMVTASDGYGPLAFIWNRGTDVTFAADGSRLSLMSIGNFLGGHVGMFHTMGTRTPGDGWMQHSSSHWFCHFVNVGEVHGKPTWTMFSNPGPVGSGR